MRSPRKTLHAAWLSAASALAVAALAVSVAPASADPAGILELQQVSGIAVGPDTLPYDTPGVPLLDHFFFRDVNDDQHLKTMTALPRVQNGAGVIDVAFSDNSADEQFEYRIAHQRVSGTGLSLGTFAATCKGACVSSNIRPPGDLVFVIRGFKFQFTGDRHIDEIGIVETGGRVRATFNDQNDDDEFSVQVDYAWVPRSRLSNILTVQDDRVHAVGNVNVGIAAGNKVIRGFHVDNLSTGGSGDNHIKRFGFLTNSSTVDIFYGDKDPADSADWSYRMDYATLN